MTRKQIKKILDKVVATDYLTAIQMQLGEQFTKEELLKQLQPFVDQFLALFQSEERKTIEEINMGIRKLSGQWEGQTKDWVEGNAKAFRAIINYLETMNKRKK